MARMIVFEVLIHHLDVLRSLAGPLAVRGAVLANRAGATRGEDTAAILLADAAGAPVLCTGTMAASGAPPIGEDALEIAGTEGTIRFDGRTLSCDGAQSGTLAWEPEAIYQSGYDLCLAHFADAIAAGSPFETAASDNLATLRLVEDAYSAAAAIPSTRP
jgi:predicted dehydrogenase